MAEKKIIAVVGATGAQGGGLVRAILSDPSGGFAARAITRDVELRQGEGAGEARRRGRRGRRRRRRRASKKAFAGAYGAYCVTFFWAHFSPEKEMAEAGAHGPGGEATPASSTSIWSTLEDTRKWVPLSDNRMPTLMGKYKVPHFDAKGEADHVLHGRSASRRRSC